MLEVNLDEEKNTSARELTESKRKIISQMAADENNGTELAEEEEREDIPSADDKPISTAAEEGSDREAPNPILEHEEEITDESPTESDETHDLPADSTSTDEEDLTSLINEAKNLKEKGSLYTSQLLSEKINAIEKHLDCLTANDIIKQEIEDLKKELIELIKEESLTKLFDEPEERQI